jgi:hypothetical protein
MFIFTVFALVLLVITVYYVCSIQIPKIETFSQKPKVVDHHFRFLRVKEAFGGTIRTDADFLRYIDTMVNAMTAKTYGYYSFTHSLAEFEKKDPLYANKNDTEIAASMVDKSGCDMHKMYCNALTTIRNDWCYGLLASNLPKIIGFEETNPLPNNSVVMFLPDEYKACDRASGFSLRGEGFVTITATDTTTDYSNLVLHEFFHTQGLSHSYLEPRTEAEIKDQQTYPNNWGVYRDASCVMGYWRLCKGFLNVANGNKVGLMTPRFTIDLNVAANVAKGHLITLPVVSSVRSRNHIHIVHNGITTATEFFIGYSHFGNTATQPSVCVYRWQSLYDEYGTELSYMMGKPIPLKFPINPNKLRINTLNDDPSAKYPLNFGKNASYMLQFTKMVVNLNKANLTFTISQA